MNYFQHSESEHPLEIRQDTGTWVLTWAGILASFLAILYFTYLGFVRDAWQLYIVASSMVGLLLTAIISTIMIRRKKIGGIWFFLVGGQICIFLYSLLIDGRGLIGLACILTLSSLVAIQSLSTQGFRRAFNLALFFGTLAGLTDFIYLPFQFVLPNDFKLFGPGVITIVTLLYALNLIRNFRSFNTRVQIVFTFTTLCLAALGLFSLVMTIFIQRRIAYDYNYGLANSAEHTAIRLQELAPAAIMLTTVLLGIISIVGLFIAKILSNPFKELTEIVKLGASGNLDVRAPVFSGDDAGSLAQAFNDMMAQIRLKLQVFENTIAKRDQEAEHHAKQMNTLAEVSSTIATTREIDELLPKIAQLISQHFGYYHVGIFLLDSTGEYAVLQAANSKGGERMMARNLQVRVDEKGIVGYVISNKEPRIVGDVLQDGQFLINPDLPDTRSEMAVPLLAGDRVIGVLDVQSTEPREFAQDDIITLRLLATQVAIAIDNARLFRENQDALRSIQRAYGDLSQEAWSRLLHEQPKLGYLANRLDFVYTPANGWHPEMIQASQTGSTIQVSDDTLAIPIKERNHILGILRLRKPDSQRWSKEELALAETLAQQLYLALENARLYQETQRRAERERLASEITAKMRASNDPQVILQTAIQELRRALNIPCEQVMPRPAPRTEYHSPPQQNVPSQDSE